MSDNNIGARQAVVWPTFRQHENAAKRDRPKHYPGAAVRIHWMQKGDYAKVHTTAYSSAFRKSDAEQMTTAEYVAEFCRLNNLTGESNET